MNPKELLLLAFQGGVVIAVVQHLASYVAGVFNNRKHLNERTSKIEEAANKVTQVANNSFTARGIYQSGARTATQEYWSTQKLEDINKLKETVWAGNVRLSEIIVANFQIRTENAVWEINESLHQLELRRALERIAEEVHQIGDHESHR